MSVMYEEGGCWYKECTVCHTIYKGVSTAEKTFELFETRYFYRKTRARDDLAPQCVKCHYAGLKVSQEKYRLQRIARKYGITYEELMSLYEGQDKRCLHCRELMSFNKRAARKVAVDHDHLTHQFRGLLCVNCNVGFGMYSENPYTLQRAADYARKYHTGARLIRMKFK